MSRYSKMQAPPFWMWMFRIAGIACLVTLLTPTAYLLKYSLIDRPREDAIASSTETSSHLLSSRPIVDAVQFYIRTAENSESSSTKEQAIEQLGGIASSRAMLVTRPVECLRAKLALEQVASTDPDQAVRTTAQTVLMRVASNGAVIVR